MAEPGSHPAESVSFTAAIYEIGINFALDVPAEVSAYFGIRGHIPVVGTVDGVPLQATFVPIGGGHHRLFLNAQTRGAIGKGAGDEVSLELRYDPSDRQPPVPKDLEEALRAEGAWQAWEAWTPSQRKEYIIAINDAKTAQTRARRIGWTVDTVLGRPRRR